MLFATGCAAQVGPPPSNPIKLAVHRDATLSVDGKLTPLSELAGDLDAAQAAHKVAMYWRDDPNADPPPDVAALAHAVIGQIIQHRLSVCFAADDAFSGCRRMGNGQ
ncbi:MAG TPA: hypothetical protein VGL58_01360 [Caulobacteraceae bacterium]|jgi:hypothetical protein